MSHLLNTDPLQGIAELEPGYYQWLTTPQGKALPYVPKNYPLNTPSYRWNTQPTSATPAPVPPLARIEKPKLQFGAVSDAWPTMTEEPFSDVYEEHNNIWGIEEDGVHEHYGVWSPGKYLSEFTEKYTGWHPGEFIENATGWHPGEAFGQIWRGAAGGGSNAPANTPVDFTKLFIYGGIAIAVLAVLVIVVVTLVKKSKKKEVVPT